MHKMVVENLILIFRVEMSLFYFESIYTYFLCITEITAITNVQSQIQVYFNTYLYMEDGGDFHASGLFIFQNICTFRL